MDIHNWILDIYIRIMDIHNINNWIPHTKASDTRSFDVFFWFAPEQTVE